MSDRRLWGIWDVLLLVTLLVLSGVLFLHHHRQSTQTFAVIRENDRVIGRYPLNEDRLIIIHPGIEVEIKDGRARMKKSTCLNQLCVKQGWNHSMPIVCVPCKIAIQFESEREDMHITY